MKARFINEIKRNQEGTGLGAIGIGRVAMIKGYKTIEKMMGANDTSLLIYNDHSLLSYVYPKETLPHILNSLNCNIDDLIVLGTDALDSEIRWKFLDETVFYNWRSEQNDKLTYFEYKPNKIFNKESRLEYVERIDCTTSPEWGIAQMIVFKDFAKTYERTGDNYFLIRYK